MDGWTVTQGEERKGAGAAAKRGEGMCCYGGAAAAPLPRWMKAPRPAVIAVTNLLRFSARLEARGRGSLFSPDPRRPPAAPPRRSQPLHLSPDSDIFIMTTKRIISQK